MQYKTLLVKTWRIKIIPTLQISLLTISDWIFHLHFLDPLIMRSLYVTRTKDHSCNHNWINVSRVSLKCSWKYLQNFDYFVSALMCSSANITDTIFLFKRLLNRNQTALIFSKVFIYFLAGISWCFHLIFLSNNSITLKRKLCCFGYTANDI